MCIICTREALKCPLNAGPGYQSETYAIFLANVKEFKQLNQLNQLPVPLPFEQGLEVAQLVENQGTLDKLCHLKFRISKLQRARKRESDQVNSAADKRRRLLCLPLDKGKCIYCGKQDGHLHEFQTLDADLQETALPTPEGHGWTLDRESKLMASCMDHTTSGLCSLQ